MLQASLIDDADRTPPEIQWVEVFSTTIPGEPQQRGSKTPWVPEEGPKGEICELCRLPKRRPKKDQYGRTKVILMDSNKQSAPYMTFARGWLKEKYGHGRKLIDCAVGTAFRFYFARPISHYGTGKNAGIVKASAPQFHVQAPDESKLARCVEDCMTETVWTDDKLVVARLHPSGKFWTTDRARTELTVYVPAEFADKFKDNF
jgi:hypothetical protein